MITGWGAAGAAGRARASVGVMVAFGLITSVGGVLTAPTPAQAGFTGFTCGQTVMGSSIAFTDVTEGDTISWTGDSASVEFDSVDQGTFTPGTVITVPAGVSTVEVITVEGPLTVTCTDGEPNDNAGANVEGAAIANARNTIVNTPDFTSRIGGGDGGGSTATMNIADGVATFDVIDGETGLGVWARGLYGGFDVDTPGFDADGDTITVQGGVDYRVSPRVTLGVMGQGDWIDLEGGNGVDTDGGGYLVGPYIAAALTESVFFETMIMGGQSFNTETATNGVEADYDATRFFATGRLSGAYYSGQWLVRPDARLSYYVEDSDAFTDGNGVAVGSQTTSLGQFTFGPEVGYDLVAGPQTVRPFVGLRGVVSFAEGDAAVNGTASGADGFSGRVNGGLEATLGRASFRGELIYDGLGDDDFEYLTGAAYLRLPLN